MKVLQTLGRTAGSSPARPSAFYYQRTQRGIQIEGIFGGDPIEVLIEHGQWMRILQEIDKSKLRLFSISSDQDDTAAPQSLHDLIRKSLKESGFPGQIDPSLLGYVTAILLNEGTIELFQGKTGDGRRHRISVRAAPKNAAAE